MALMACGQIRQSQIQSNRSAKKPRATSASPVQDAQLTAQDDHLKLQRGAATNAKREERDDGGKKGDHRQMCYDDIAENLRYLRHLWVFE
jgi:hypothetical protein